MLEKTRWDRLGRDDLDVQVFFSPAEVTTLSHPLAMKITFQEGSEAWFNEAEIKMIIEMISKPPSTPPFIVEEEENESDDL